MEKVVLKATKREVLGRKVGALRRAGKLPAVLYGHGIASTPIMLEAHEAALKLFTEALAPLGIDPGGVIWYSALSREGREQLWDRLLPCLGEA